MRIHILGIGGTFMGSLAILARQLGHEVTGVDGEVYEPMASRLKDDGIAYQQYHNDPWLKHDAIDCVIVGNALSRGHPSIEWLMDSNLHYTSGSAWLAEQVLKDKKVIAVSGTHGKTTTTTLIAWMLEQKGIKPGYLIAGVPIGLDSNVTAGDSEWFVIESDEYDTAYFDKRPKFMHYWPDIAVVNNIEFDHADIYDDLNQIIKQFGFFLRTIAPKGHVIAPKDNHTVEALLQSHPWSKSIRFGVGGELWAERIASEKLRLHHADKQVEINWHLIGEHNLQNCLAAIGVWLAMGFLLEDLPDMGLFTGVKRRLELQHKSDNRLVYSDFGHHPTAISLTLDGIKQHFNGQAITAIIHMTTNSMHGGAHDLAMLEVVKKANQTLLVCDTEDAFKRVSHWQLPANTKVVLCASGLEAALAKASHSGEGKSNGANLKQSITVVFSNKSVAPLIDVAVKAPPSSFA